MRKILLRSGGDDNLCALVTLNDGTWALLQEARHILQRRDLGGSLRRLIFKDAGVYYYDELHPRLTMNEHEWVVADEVPNDWKVPT